MPEVIVASIKILGLNIRESKRFLPLRTSCFAVYTVIPTCQIIEALDVNKKRKHQKILNTAVRRIFIVEDTISGTKAELSVRIHLLE